MSLCCATPWRVVGGEVVLAAALAVVQFVVADRLALVLTIPVTVIALLSGARDAWQRPVLALTDDGVAIARGLSSVRFTWNEIDAVRPSTGRRAGAVVGVEIDLGQTLVRVPRHRLGRPADDVVETARRLSHAASPGPSGRADPPRSD